MSLELLFGLIVAVVVIAVIYFNRSGSGLDVNQDGKVDIDDAKKAVENTVEGVKKTVRKPRATKQAAAPTTAVKTTKATKTKTTNGSRKK